LEKAPEMGPFLWGEPLMKQVRGYQSGTNFF